MNTVALIAFLGTLYLAFFVVERAWPLRRRKAPLPWRLLVNITITVLAFAAAAMVVKPVSDWSLEWTGMTGFGLMASLGLPAAIEFALTFLLLDLSFYYWHLANHRVRWLWRIHVVHHVDPDLDVSTAFRFHFAEVALSAGFRLLQITLLGPALGTYAIYEAAFQACTLFHHSNIRLPQRAERGINAAIVTPRMHGIHHSQVSEETNSNFGIVFTWWDRLHRTLRLDVPQETVVIGIPGYSRPEDNRTIRLLSLPFLRQRDYWGRK